MSPTRPRSTIFSFPAFATVREAAKRALGQRHFDVQLIGGMVLHEGQIAEMRTGEGKTLVATLAGLSQRAGGPRRSRRHRQRLPRQARRRMDGRRSIASSACRSASSCMASTTSERREAYACDITYGTNNEFGFDYLRDNMKYRSTDMVQRGHRFAIVDEVDSILIDEARTPLIISGPTRRPLGILSADRRAHPAARRRKTTNVDEKQRSVAFTEVGNEQIEETPARAGLLEGIALRRREHLDRPPRQSGAARPQAVPERQGLHRARTAKSSSSTNSPAA